MNLFEIHTYVFLESFQMLRCLVSFKNTILKTQIYDVPLNKILCKRHYNANTVFMDLTFSFSHTQNILFLLSIFDWKHFSVGKKELSRILLYPSC